MSPFVYRRVMLFACLAQPGLSAFLSWSCCRRRTLGARLSFLSHFRKTGQQDIPLCPTLADQTAQEELAPADQTVLAPTFADQAPVQAELIRKLRKLKERDRHPTTSLDPSVTEWLGQKWLADQLEEWVIPPSLRDLEKWLADQLSRGLMPDPFFPSGENVLKSHGDSGITQRQSPLDLAVSQGLLSIVKMLVENEPAQRAGLPGGGGPWRADVEFVMYPGDESWCSPPWVAARDPEMLTYLLGKMRHDPTQAVRNWRDSKGANVILRRVSKWKDPLGTDSERKFAEERKRAVLRILVDHGASVDFACPSTGETALMRVAEQGHHFVSRLLLEFGADPAKRREGDEKTAEEIAEYHGYFALAVQIRKFHVQVVMQVPALLQRGGAEDVASLVRDMVQGEGTGGKEDSPRSDGLPGFGM